MNCIFMLRGFGTYVSIVKLVYIVFVIIWVLCPIVRFLLLLWLDRFRLLLLFNLLNLSYRCKNFLFCKMNVNKVFNYFDLSAKLCFHLFRKWFVKKTSLVFVSNKNDVAWEAVKFSVHFNQMFPYVFWCNYLSALDIDCLLKAVCYSLQWVIMQLFWFFHYDFICFGNEVNRSRL